MSKYHYRSNESIRRKKPAVRNKVRELSRAVIAVPLATNFELRCGGFVRIFDALFGCWHKNISFPQTHKSGKRRSAAATETGTYVVCLDCGQEFAYDWQQMRVISAGELTGCAQSHVEMEAKAS